MERPGLLDAQLHLMLSTTAEARTQNITGKTVDHKKAAHSSECAAWSC
jgi:hypothetical protein